jgi:hypothetical protein
MADGDYILIKRNGTATHDEKVVAAEVDKVLGFDSSKNPVMKTLVGGGDVTGPASSTDGSPALFNGTGGKTLKNSTPSGTGNPVMDNSPTLITPKIGSGGSINDANGNEVIKLPSVVANATNELTVSNAPNGSAPSIAATGSSDANVDIALIPKGAGRVTGISRIVEIRLLDKDTSWAVGTSIGGDFRIPWAHTLKNVGVYCDTAGTTNVSTVDINEAGTSVLSTKVTLDSTEKSSQTAATAPVISDASIAADAIYTFDIDAISTTPPKGLVVWMEIVM